MGSEDGDDISLQLNFSTSKSFRQRKSISTKPERIAEKRKERRASYDAQTKSSLTRSTERGGSKPLKQFNPSQSNSGSSVSAIKQTSPVKRGSGNSFEQSSKGLKRPAPSASIHDDKKRTKQTMIFKSNPEIPTTDSVEVKPVKEVIFSADSFSEQKLHPLVVSTLEHLGVNLMTSIQQISLPYILDGRDVLIKSQTGSGKTYAYVVPIVEKLRMIEPRIQRSDGPYCIVIVPTRELALQSLQTITNVLKKIHWIVPGCIMGGDSYKSQKARLRRGINILVCTTGCLLYHMECTTSLDLKNVQFLVIDEADRLSEMGFEKDMTSIVDTLKKKCKSQFQTILLSATLGTGVEKLAGMCLKNPARLNVNELQVTKSDELDNVGNTSLTSEPTKFVCKSLVNAATTLKRKEKTDITGSMKTDAAFAMPESLSHNFVVVPSKLRLTTLATFLLSKCRSQGGSNACKAIVFMSTQNSVEFHHRLLETCLNHADPTETEESVLPAARKNGEHKTIELFKLHGGMEQKDRTNEFNNFSSAKAGVLVSTDVAARGLDLPGVEWIVQYNTPGQPRDYIHRVGRTARIGSKGSALLFLTPAEVKYTELLNSIDISATEMKFGSILSTLRNSTLHIFTKNKELRTVERRANLLQALFESSVNHSPEMKSLATEAYRSFIRGYATYSADLKHIFHIKNLHLGHVATSFALVETPGDIANRVARSLGSTASRDRKRAKPGKHQRVERGRHGSSMSTMAMSEFSDGFDNNVKGPQHKAKIN